MDNYTQLQILKELMLASKLKYKDIHNKFQNHDLFNYHLKELQNKNYIIKEESFYLLTEKGKKIVSFMEEDGTLQGQFKVGTFIWVLKKEKDKVFALLYKRLKHPHYGYIGTISAKLKYAETIENSVKRDLFEETEIKAKEVKLIGAVREFFRNEKGEVATDGVFFTVVVEKFEGEIKYKSIEGEYFWCEIDKILELENVFREGFEHGIPQLKRYLKSPVKYTPYLNELDPKGLKY